MKRKINLANIKQSPIRRESLPPELQPRIEQTYRDIAHYSFPTLEQWELDIMRSHDPADYIYEMEVLAKALRLYTTKYLSRKSLTRERMEELIFALALISTTNKPNEDATVTRQLTECFREAGGVQELAIFDTDDGETFFVP